MTVEFSDGSQETVYSNVVKGKSVSGIAYSLKKSSSYEGFAQGK